MNKLDKMLVRYRNTEVYKYLYRLKQYELIKQCLYERFIHEPDPMTALGILTAIKLFEVGDLK